MENCQGDLKRTKRLARQLLEFCQTTGLALPDELKDACSELEQRCAETSFQVVVVGMFSRGKSTFLNALIGRRLLYESDREATGSITFLRNSALSSVEIRSPGGTERFPLDEHSYDKIRERVDRNNKESSATQVFVDCPLEHFDEDILFVDTPGLNGLGEEQAKVTRQAMDHADAVIFLVLPKSLEETELALLRGENPYIGKLRTRNILFVMTKIGPMLDGVPPEREEEKLDRFREEIKRQLRRNGLEDSFQNTQIHAVDSRDFLQAVDDSFYAQMLHPEGSPSREELRRRSRFDPFRQALVQRLERGNRARQTQSDMWELMLDICEMLRETLEAQLARRKQAGAERRKELEDKRDQYEHTKRRSFLRISKYIREQIDTLNDGVEKDSAQRQAAVQKKADDYIYHSFNREDDFCPGEYRKLTEQLRRWTSEASKGMAGNVNKVYQSLSAQLSQFTEQTIRETFGLPSSADYFMETISIQRGQVQDVSLMDAEKELEQEIHTARDTMGALENKMKRLRREIQKQQELYQAGQREVTDRHSQEMKAIGTRPSPRTKYTTKYREVKVFLWFKKQESYQEASLDYAPVEEYDRKHKAEQTRYERDRGKLRQLQAQIDRQEEELGRLEREKRTAQSELENMQREQALRARFRQERWLRERAKMLDRQKDELTLTCRERLASAFRQLNSAIVTKNAATMEHLVQTTDELLNEVLARYLAQLQERIDQQSQVSYEDLEELVKRAQTLDREIKEERTER